ncbi:MMPL family transporter [Alteribacter natronophilus]|uniref:MMPL family transporter n=1 Tax=Alteribacter natronophilus TaxID=2583810 RepID=UPI00110D3597|nr:MMPL family transporter [Alteribacter natronophilus]TMW71618.1 MMPL family transporter [Alteribacter natronophilus]
MSLRWIYLLPVIWVAGAVLLFIYSPDLDELVRERGQAGVPEGYPSQLADEILADNEGASGETVLAVYHSDDPLTNTELEDIEEVLNGIGSEIGGFPVEEVVTPFDSEQNRELLISDDETTAIAFVRMDMLFSDTASVRDDLDDALQTETVPVLISGSSVIEDDVIISSEEGLATTEIITVIFVLVILLIVFRSLAAPLVPLVTVGASYAVSVGIVSYMAEYFHFPVSNFTQIFIVAVLFGIGTDYCILLLNRFKEELIQAEDRTEAMRRTFKAVGPTVASSALTGFIGFFAIGFAQFDLYRSAMGVSIGIVVLTAAIWVWVPAAMMLLGEKLYWPSRSGLQVKPSRTWGAFGRFSLYRPGWTVLILAAIMIPSVLTYDNATSFNSLDEIGDDFESVQAFHVTADRFGDGEMFPATVVIEHDEPWNSQEWLPYIELVTYELGKIDGVQEVRSATRPEGSRIEEFTVPYLAGELADGTDEIRDGLTELAEGLEELADELRNEEENGAGDVDELTEGTGQLAEGAREIEDGISETAAGTEEAAAGAGELEQNLAVLTEELDLLAQQLPAGSGVEELQGGLAEIESGLAELSQSLTGLSAAQDDIGTGAGELAEGAEEAAEGQEQLAASLSEIENAFEEVADGLDEAVEAMNELEDGLGEVEDLLAEIAAQQAHPLQGFFVPAEAAAEELDGVWEAYTTPNRLVTTIDVIFSVNPYSNEAMETSAVIEERAALALKGTPLEDAPIAVGGLSSVNLDLQTISNDDFLRTALVMLAGIFIVLVVLLRSLVMPLYILVSLVMTYIVSISFTEFVFVTLLGYPGITWAVPFFGFIMLMALGVDYSIFLMTRFTEDVRTHENIREAALHAMRQIGTVVLSAAVILAGTFGAMMPSGVLSLMQIGTLVLTGLLVYAVIMLPLFIPVMIGLFGNKNWWPFRRPI